MKDRAVALAQGEMFGVLKGVLHNPIADDERHLTLIERETTLRTGNAVTKKTHSIAEQLGCA
jgi:hypothetical protein